MDVSGPGPIGPRDSDCAHHKPGDSGHDHAGHDHGDHADHAGQEDHAGHDHDYRGAPRRSLIITLTLISGFMVAEVI